MVLEYSPSWHGIWEAAGPGLHGPSCDLCMTMIFTRTAPWHWSTAASWEFPADQKFGKTSLRSDLQIKCEKQNDISFGWKAKGKKKKRRKIKRSPVKFWSASNLKLQHIAEVLVILNNGWSCLKVAGVSFFVHNEN